MKKIIQHALPAILLLFACNGCVRSAGTTTPDPIQIPKASSTSTSQKGSPATLSIGINSIETESLWKMIDKETDLVLIDGRPAEQYIQGHLPGAINLTTQDLEQNPRAIQASASTPIIFYHGGQNCGKAAQSAQLAQLAGFGDVRVYLEGETGWVAAEHPLYASAEFIAQGNLVLVDLRSPGAAAAGHIPRAVNIPLDELENRISTVPMHAPVVLYADSEKYALKALALLRSKGYRRLALVTGQYDGWVKAGGRIASGAPATATTWKPVARVHEISKDAFLKAVKDGGSGIVILDVRTKEEVAAGKLSMAQSIPMDQLSKRMKELPKDKSILVYCTVGARADLAAEELNKNGYKAKFVNAAIECTGNNCTIRE